jgi:hypothetical protein
MQYSGLEREEWANPESVTVNCCTISLAYPSLPLSFINCRFSVEFMNSLGRVVEIYFCYWNPAVICKYCAPTKTHQNLFCFTVRGVRASNLVALGLLRCVCLSS